MTKYIEVYITFNKLLKESLFGTYNIDNKIYNKIKLKLGEPSNIFTRNIYYKKNSIIEEINNNYNMYQKNQYNFIICNTSIIIYSSITELDVNDIPILSKYDNYEKINTIEYNNNDYIILLEESNNKYYFHMKINNETNIFNIIKQMEDLFI
jgi:hypothetical protein